MMISTIYTVFSHSIISSIVNHKNKLGKYLSDAAISQYTHAYFELAAFIPNTVNWNLKKINKLRRKKYWNPRGIFKVISIYKIFLVVLSQIKSYWYFEVK